MTDLKYVQKSHSTLIRQPDNSFQKMRRSAIVSAATVGMGGEKDSLENVDRAAAAAAFCPACRGMQECSRQTHSTCSASKIHAEISSSSSSSPLTPLPAASSSSSTHHIPSNWSHKDVRHYLTVLICTVLLLLTPPASSTPLFASTMGGSNHHRTAKPKWVNPCGIDTSTLRRIHGHYEVRPLSNSELMQNIILAAKNALRHSRVFKEDYVKKTFRVPSWWDHHETWKDMRYDWLPSWRQIPKHLHEKTSREHLSKLKVDDSLRKIYSYLQRLAVGLEQVVLDQVLYDGLFMEEFNEAEFKLKAVLCELQVAMLEKGLTPSPPTSRSIMTKEVRDIEDASYRNMRDWYIYRDYMNGLEYVIHSFDHLKRKAL